MRRKTNPAKSSRKSVHSGGVSAGGFHLEESEADPQVRNGDEDETAAENEDCRA